MEGGLWPRRSMRILDRYVLASFCLSFVMTLVVVTFVMSLGIVFKVTDLIVSGVPWRPILLMFLYGMPQALSLAIPISVLTACLLTFGRLSADSEIVAMKASGVSVHQVMVMPLWLAMVLALLCVYVNNELVPRGNYAQRNQKANIGVTTPLQLLEVGRFISDFPGWIVYVGRKEGRTLENVRIYDLTRPGIKREIRATRGEVREESGADIVLDLFDVRVNPISEQSPFSAWAAKYPVRIVDALKKRVYRPKPSDYPLPKLISGMLRPEGDMAQLRGDDLLQHRTILAVELNKRMALASACFAFAVLGIPLGIRSHRRESSLGMLMSLVFVFFFYVFILVAEAFQKRPELFPHLITWVPVILSMAIGAWLTRRVE